MVPAAGVLSLFQDQDCLERSLGLKGLWGFVLRVANMSGGLLRVYGCVSTGIPLGPQSDVRWDLITSTG